MKKIGRILTGMVLGAAFMGTVGFCCWQYDTEEMKQAFAENEQESVLQPKMKIPERKTYKLGEEVECEGLIWKITEAEIIESYESLDSYYQTRENLMVPAEEIPRRYEDIFIDDIQFLRLKGTMTNTSETLSEKYHLSKIEICNKREDGSFDTIMNSPYGTDGRCAAATRENKILMSANDVFEVEAQETVEFEYVIEFSECNRGEACANYDLYVSISSLRPDSVYLYNGVNNKICLNIAPKHLGFEDTDVENCYEEQRDIPKMKSRQWTNLDMKQYQEKGYPLLFEKGDIRIEEEEIVDGDYAFEDWKGIRTQITEIRSVDWEEMPQEFLDRGALEDMAARYEQEFGYSRAELKILLLDINISRFEESVTKDMERYNFYENTYLFTRDEGGKRWIFGTADDWVITENSIEGGRMGHINMEKLEMGQTMTYQAAYLLPPEIYQEGVFYFCGGKLKMNNASETPVQRISIK